MPDAADSPAAYRRVIRLADRAITRIFPIRRSRSDIRDVENSARRIADLFESFLAISSDTGEPVSSWRGEKQRREISANVLIAHLSGVLEINSARYKMKNVTVKYGRRAAAWSQNLC